MDLILDLGNTNKKFAIVDAPSARYPFGTIRTLENHSVISLAGIRTFVRKHPAINACILSSVIRHPSSVISFLKDLFPFIELDAMTPLPIKNRYLTPDTLGKDRLAAHATPPLCNASVSALKLARQAS